MLLMAMVSPISMPALALDQTVQLTLFGNPQVVFQA